MTQTKPMTTPEIPTVPERAIEEFETRQHDLMRGFSECRELVDDQHFAQAGDALQAANDLLRQINDAVDPTVRAADQAHKQAVEMRRTLRAPIEQAVERLKGLIAAYTRKREEATRAEQQRQQRLLEDAARARAEAEAAERRRQEQARIERERIEAEARAGQARDEMARIEAELAQEEAERKASELAVAPLEVQEVAVPQIAMPPTETPKLQGVSTRQVWRFRIANAGMIPREYLMPDEKAIAARVRARGMLHGIEGVVAFPEDVVSVRRGS